MPLELKREGDYISIDIGRVAFNRLYLTKEDLERGLKILAEKPIFEAKDINGATMKFQKGSDGNVKWMSETSGGLSHNVLSGWTNSELEAILAARKS